MLLQQAQERFSLQQEAVHVARELDQQQLFALLQQQQHATAQEQVMMQFWLLAVALGVSGCIYHCEDSMSQLISARRNQHQTTQTLFELR
jgi:hypothetical protein